MQVTSIRTSQTRVSLRHRRRFVFVATLFAFVWISTENALAFSVGDRVQAIGAINVRSTPGGAPPSGSQTNTFGTIISGPQGALLSGTATFYTWWQVNWDAGVDGWVAQDFISAALSVPSLSSPADGATINGNAVTLIWNGVSGAGAYSIGLRDLTTNQLYNIPLVVGTSTTQSVTPGHAYRWDVASCSNSGGGDNDSNCPSRSGNRTFSAQSVAPAAPSLASPANGSTINATSVTLTWNTVSGAGAYSVGLRDVTTNQLRDIPLVTGTSTTQSVSRGHSYRWDIASCISSGGGDTDSNCPNRSGNRTFSVQSAAPAAPSLVSPANGSTINATSVTLTWNTASGAGAYSVGLRDLTTNQLRDIPLVTGTSTTQNITRGHSYRWDVASCISSGGGDNDSNCPNRSGNRTFSAQSAPPAAPSLVSPTDGAVINATSVTLKWNAATGAGAYSVGLRDLTTNQLRDIPLVTGTSTTQSITRGHAYRWDVASCSNSSGGDNTINCPNRSADRTFSVQSSLALIVTGVASTYRTTKAPYSPVIKLDGARLNTIYQITWTCTDPHGARCVGSPYVWTVANWSGKFSRTSDSSAQIKPALLVQGDVPGTYHWKVTFKGAGASVSKSFAVVFAPPPILSVSPSAITAPSNAGSVKVAVANLGSGKLNYSAKVSSGSSWISIVSGGAGQNAGTIAISLKANSGKERSGKILVSAPSANPSEVTLTIAQAAKSEGSLVFGFDISSIQYGSTIDWATIAASSVFDSYSDRKYPVRFTILRASKGAADTDDCEFKDPKFSGRFPAAKAAGLYVGAYHVASVRNDATGKDISPVDEARFFVKIAKNAIKPGYMKPFLDVEDHSCANLSNYNGATSLADWVDRWMGEVKRLTGVTPIIYTSRWFLNDSRNPNSLKKLASKYEVWLADYTTPPTSPTNPATISVVSPWTVALQQYDVYRKQVPGLGSKVDMDVFHGTETDFDAVLMIQDAASPTRLIRRRNWLSFYSLRN